MTHSTPDSTANAAANANANDANVDASANAAATANAANAAIADAANADANADACEGRVLAVLLGEADAAEQQAVRALLDASPALRVWRDRAAVLLPALVETLHLARAAALPAWEPARRDALLQRLRTADADRAATAAPAQSGTGGSPVSPQPAPTPQSSDAHSPLECGTSVPLCAKTSVSRPDARGTSEGEGDTAAFPQNLSNAHGTKDLSLNNFFEADECAGERDKAPIR